MPRSLLFLLGLILVSGLVSGSEAKHEDKSLKKREKKRRTGSEGSISSGRYSEFESRHSLSGKDYTEETLRRIGFAIGEEEARGIKIADVRHQDSSDSLAELASNEPGSPAFNVVGSLDRHPHRIVAGFNPDRYAPPVNQRGVLPPGCFDVQPDNNDGDTSQRQRRGSESGTSSTKSSKSDGSKKSKK